MSNPKNNTYHMFDVYGIELEYILVDKDSLDILPISGELIKKLSGKYQCCVELGKFTLANEFVKHVVELNTNKPVKSFAGLDKAFYQKIQFLLKNIGEFNAILMPSAMHPLMNPKTDTNIWSYENKEIYSCFHKIFNCNRHGWANIQSIQLNLPFGNEDEFGRLHAAIRLVLPILPALCASSPLVQGRLTGIMDNRLNAYITHCNKVPILTGNIIPEQVFKISDYEALLKRLYKSIGSYKGSKILQEEWVNARGVIPRFERSAFEIRLMDSQECTLAEVSICKLVASAIKQLANEKYTDYRHQKQWKEQELKSILLKTMRKAEHSIIGNKKYLKAFGMNANKCTAGALWKHILSNSTQDFTTKEANYLKTLKTILNKGTLSTRIIKKLKGRATDKRIKKVYMELCNCLKRNKLFNV